jgi:hypothetical protein
LTGSGPSKILTLTVVCGKEAVSRESLDMLKRMLWVLPLVLAMSPTWLDAQNPERKKRPPQGVAPELDPKAAGAALALLIGGSLLLSERRRRRKPDSE